MKEEFNDGNKETGSHWISPHKSKPIISVDFDHTITQNCVTCSDWDGKHRLQKGVKEALQKLSKDFDIVILTAGGNYFRGYKRMVKKFLKENGIPFTRIDASKPPAVFLIDDRAIHHEGWEKTLEEINRRINSRGKQK